MNRRATPPGVRIHLDVQLAYRVGEAGADFVFNIHPAHTACQSVGAEQLRISPPVMADIQTEPATDNRYLRLRAEPGDLVVAYSATVDLHPHRAPPDTLAELPIHRLPLEAIGYIYPSRYCESDRLVAMATKQFGHLPPGYRRVQAIMQWVRQQVTYTSNTSSSRTTAVETLIDQVGVCRDFAHLMIALCRAVNIPARFATGTDYGADPAIGPPDFHAYVEVYLGDRWYIVDPSGTGIPMGFVRIGTGRDAADVAFATIFGAVESSAAPRISAVAVVDPARGLVWPVHGEEALSTDAGHTRPG